MKSSTLRYIKKKKKKRKKKKEKNKDRKISTSIHSDGVIDLAEFQQALGLKNSAFAERLFTVFDMNKDEVINFKVYKKKEKEKKEKERKEQR